MNPSSTPRSANECEIFMTALDIDAPEQRSAYLGQACAGDAALRQRIESLLQHRAQAGDFLETPAVSRQPQPPRTEVHLEAEHPRLDFLAPSDDPAAIGCMGPYTVTNVIGRGGMGVVFKARDASLNRVVAIKVLAPELAGNAMARKRFLREARAAAAIVHQHVVTIHAVNEERPPYLVMEYVDGLSLQKKIDATGPLELNETLRIGVQVAAGLAAAHAQRVVHRDIKPSNILLENSVERVRITDFGLARAADDVEVTRPGDVAGTPQYMSPEQAQGHAVDSRSDLFNLGCVLYAMCTGRSPFRAESTIAAIRRVCDDAPRPIREVNPETPKWLTEIIDRLVAKRPEDRFQTAQEVAELLGQHLEDAQHLGSERRPATPPAPFGMRVRARTRWGTVALILMSAMTALGVTETTGVTQWAETLIRIVAGEGTLVVETDDPAVKVTIDGDGGIVISGAGPQEVRLKPGRYHLQATNDDKTLTNEVVTITRGGKQVVKVSREPVALPPTVPFALTPAAPGALDNLDPAKIPAEQRFDWQPRELVQVLGDHDGRHWTRAVSTAFRPDGKMIASSDRGGEVRLWDAGTLREQAVLKGHHGIVWSVAFSADGRFVLSGAEDKLLKLWDSTTGEQLRQFDGHRAQVFGVALSVDGRQALSGGGDDDNSVRLWDLETGQERLRCTGHTAGVYNVAFSADGSRALSGSRDRTLRLWDLKTGEELRCFRGHTDEVRSVALSADGRRALSGGGTSDPTVRLWDVETGSELRTFAAHTEVVVSVAFSPDGHRALSCGGFGDMTCRLWDVEEGKELRCLEPAGGGSASFSPDGRRAVSAGLGLRLWDLETGQELRARAGHAISARGVVFSPDGRQLLSCSEYERNVLVWDVEQRRTVGRFEGHTAPVNSVAISPDGRLALSGGRDMVMRLWDVATGREQRCFREHGSSIESVSFSPDGRLALAAGGEGVRLSDVASGRELRHFVNPGCETRSAVFSPDGHSVLSVRPPDSVVLWDVAGGHELRRYLSPSAAIFGTVIAPDNRSAFSAGIGGMLQRWDLDPGEGRRRTFFKWHTAHVLGLAISPEGKTLASCGEDGRVILWEAETGNKLREWQLPGVVLGVVYAPDGRHLATANGNGTVDILRL